MHVTVGRVVYTYSWLFVSAWECEYVCVCVCVAHTPSVWVTGSRCGEYYVLSSCLILLYAQMHKRTRCSTGRFVAQCLFATSSSSLLEDRWVSNAHVFAWVKCLMLWLWNILHARKLAGWALALSLALPICIALLFFFGVGSSHYALSHCQIRYLRESNPYSSLYYLNFTGAGALW